MHILHLSDLHFSQTNQQIKNFLNDVLIADLESLHQEYDKPDFIVFSGDLVHDPDEGDVYFYLGDFINEILNSLSLDASRLIFCPGNHDVSRKVLTEKKVFRDGLYTHAQDSNYISDIYSSGKLNEYVFDISSGFFEFCELFEQKWTDPFYKITNYADGLRFISLNSSFYCSLDGSANDRGKLIYPLEALEKALSDHNGQELYVVMHHPVIEFAEPYNRVMQPRILNSATAVMFGHIHSAQPIHYISPSSNCMFLQSGALYDRPQVYTGYTLYTRLEGGQVARFRSYQSTRRSFDIGVDVSANGIFFPQKSDEEAWNKRNKKISPNKLINHLRTNVLSEIEGQYGENIIQQKLYDIYVFPYFGTDNVSKINEDTGIEGSELRFTEYDIKKNDENIFAFFPEECGATSFLSYLALDMCNAPDEFAAPRIPILLDITMMRAYKAQIDSAVRGAMPDSDHKEFGWKSLKNLQPFLILVDNYIPGNQVHKSIFLLLIKYYPSARFVVVAKTPLAIHAKILPNLGFQTEVQRIVLHPFSRRQVRVMVEKSGLPEDMDKNLIVDDIATRFTAIGIPLSGPIISMYLHIIKQKGKYAPVNAALILENFVEIILEKIDSSIFREDFDYGEQITILCEIAKYYVKNGVAAVTYEDMYANISDHYSKIGINRTANKVIEYFMEKKILEQVGQKIYFRHGIFLTYLTAKEMINNREYFEYCTSKENCGRFVSEIDIYFGLKRNDLSGLERIGKWYVAIRDEILKDVANLADPDTLQDLSLPMQKDMGEFIGEVSRRIIGSESGGKADKDLDGDRTTREQFKQKIAKPVIQNNLVQFIHLLRAYSVAIKNAEDISKEEKEKHLQIVINGWALVTAFAVRLFGLLFDDGVVEAGDTVFVIAQEGEVDGRMLRIMMANIPTYISNIVRINVGTEKLDWQLKKVGRNSIERFLAEGLRLDMRLPEVLTDIERILVESKKKPLIIEAWMWKLRDSFMRFGLNEIYTAQFRRLIAEADADVMGLKGSDRSKRISQTLQRVDKTKLIRRRNS